MQPVAAIPWILLGLAVLAFLVALVAYGHEAEEVVVLRPAGPGGTMRETRLWVAEHQGSPWIVTGRDSDHDRASRRTRESRSSDVWRHFSERDDLHEIAVALRFTPRPAG